MNPITTNGTTRLIPDDEPVFLLRGQDKHAADTVRHWARLVEADGCGLNPIAAVAREHADKMDAWPKKKAPDLKTPNAELRGRPLADGPARAHCCAAGD